MKKKNCFYMVPAVGLYFLSTFFCVDLTSALTYQTEVDVDFTFNPVVNLAVSGDLIISDLSPGNSSDSNIITITAGSNSAYGYTLYSTVGNSSSNYTDLRLSPSNSTNKFTNLSANKATLSAFSDNTWGYSYCNFTSNANACNTTSNWVSGNVGSTSAGYNGLPLYNSSNQESGIMLINSNTPSETNLKFKIGAKASTAQASGTYSNVINFIGVGKVVTTSYTISYNGNGGTGTPSNQTGTTDTGAVKLTATAPTKEDFIFKGWCDTDNTSDPSTCSGNTTQPGHILGLNTTANSITKNLYAVWEDSSKSIYSLVAAMSKGTQTNDSDSSTGIKANIAAPTSSNPISSNSGVYEYDSSVFGSSSDANNNNPIYYYRGILDSYGNTGSYGSDGLSDAYPNYVILQSGNTKDTTDTCWRIIRTTGSGGVKMIYNGQWTGATCANASTNAQVATQVYGIQGNSSQTTYWFANINRVGYTFNNDSSIQDITTQTSIDTVFGGNSNYSTTNTTDSNIKNYIENTWFTSVNGISDFEYILEPSAGYCNDRTLYASDTTVAPYSRASAVSSQFAVYTRTSSTSTTPTLLCSSSRNIVDLYTTADATDGNKQLKKPAALLTADEATFAGSGSGTNYYNNTKSFLNSSSAFWLMSPGNRENSYSYVLGVNDSNGFISRRGLTSNIGVRPVISLREGIKPISGTGIATDPWVVEPLTMQGVTSSDLASMMPNTGDTAILTDSRDGQNYTIGKLADGNYWFLDNLALDLTNSTVLNGMNESNTNASNATLGYLKNGGGTTSDKYATAGVSNWTSGYSFSAPLVNMASKDVVPSDATSTEGGWKVGGYYNYCAASAGSYCYGNGTDYGTSSGNATEDICPADWRLPTGGMYGEYYTLYNNDNYNSYENYRLALHLPLSGYLNNGSTFHRESSAGWWSSKRYDDRNMYSLYANMASSFLLTYYNYRSEGYSVRCIFDS